MGKKHEIWLVANEGSGSVREELLDLLHRSCEESDVCIAARTNFPSDDIPSPADLRERGIDTVIVLGGDGTINAVVSALAGWDGALLPLPGGTQNLLTKSLHGDAEVDSVIAAFAGGRARKVRPNVLLSSQGVALAGLMIGPGTSWNDVREAIRAGDPAAMLSAMGSAISGTAGDAPVRIAQPEAGDPRGYPILELLPKEGGIDVTAFHARTGADFLGQTWALLRQEFREGPHETFGAFDEVLLASTGEEPLDLLLDGEPAHGTVQERVTLGDCPVDLIATQPEGA